MLKGIVTTNTLYYILYPWSVYKNPILIRINSKSLHNIGHVHASEKNIKIENSFLATFDEIPCTIAHGLRPYFRVTLKIYKKSNIDQNQLKLSIQHKNIYMHQKKL